MDMCNLFKTVSIHINNGSEKKGPDEKKTEIKLQYKGKYNNAIENITKIKFMYHPKTLHSTCFILRYTMGYYFYLT